MALVLTDTGSTRWGPPFPGFIQALALPASSHGARGDRSAAARDPGRRRRRYRLRFDPCSLRGFARQETIITKLRVVMGFRWSANFFSKYENLLLTRQLVEPTLNEVLAAQVCKLSFVVVHVMLAFGGFSNAIVHAQQATTRRPRRDTINWPASSYDYQNSNNDPQTDINVEQRGEPGAQMDLPDPRQPVQHPGRSSRSWGRDPGDRVERDRLHRDAIQPHNRAQQPDGSRRLVVPGGHVQVHRGESGGLGHT